MCFVLSDISAGVPSTGGTAKALRQHDPRVMAMRTRRPVGGELGAFIAVGPKLAETARGRYKVMTHCVSKT